MTHEKSRFVVSADWVRKQLGAPGFRVVDAAWYLRQYPDVACDGVRPAVHFLRTGARDRRSPGPRFDTRFYLSRYPDVAKSGMNPLIHYLRAGSAEGRLIAPPDYLPADAAPEGASRGA